MSSGGEIVIKVSGDTSGFEKSISGLGSKASGVFKGVMSAQIVTGAFSALTDGFKAAVNAGKDFEAQMSQVYALSGATAEEQKLLADTAKAYGESTKFSATQAGEALSYMALAGWDAQQSVEALGGVLNLAAASGMDLGQASDMVTDFLSAFGMECEQAGYMADIMAYAQSHANTSAQQLGEAYGNCAATMHSAGQDIETTTAFLEALANQGIKGSEAGTQMAAVMRDLTQKMKDGKIMIGDTAVEVMDANGNFRDLNDIMIDVGKATEGMGTAEASAALMETFTARSVKAVQTVLNEGMENVNAYEEALRSSEGTAVEQSKMMMDNLEGDITIFQSALEGLEITAYESFNGLARGMVQEGTSIISEITKAGKSGGLEGMFGAAIDQIPNIRPKLIGGAKKLISGFSNKLPSMIKDLVAQIPNLLGSAVDLIPDITESLFSAASATVEGLIARAPELIEMLLNGVGNAFIGITQGALNIGKSIFNGLKSMLGIDQDNIENVINDAFENLDPVKVDSIPVGDVNVSSVSVDGEIDTSAYVQKIQTAKSEITTAIASLELSQEDEAALTRAIMVGSGADALAAALSALGVDDAKAQEVAGKLSSAIQTIHDALAGEYGLSEEQLTEISNYVAAGHSLQEALTIIGGLSAEDAKAAAEGLQPAIDEVSGILSGLGIDIDASALMSACMAANGDIVAALKLLGVDDATIQQCLENMDTLSESVATKAEAMFNGIKTAFTDGVSGNDSEAASEAQVAANEYYDDIEAKIDQWAAAAKAQLEQMGLDADEMAVKTAEIDAQAESMKATLDGCREGTQQWITDNANAATEVVQNHFSELDSLMTTVEELEARIETLKAELDPVAYSTRAAVESGSISNQSLQLESIKLTAKERDAAVTEAAAAYKQTVDDAAQTFADADAALNEELQGLYAARSRGEVSDDEYATMLEDIGQRRQDAADKLEADTKTAEETLKLAEEEANRVYKQHMMAIMQGMIEASGMGAEFDGIAEQYSAASGAQNLLTAIQEGTFAETDFSVEGKAEEVLASLGLSDSDIEYIANEVGTSSEELKSSIIEMLSSGETELQTENGVLNSQWFVEEFANVAEEGQKAFDDAFTAAFSNYDTAPVFEVIQRGLNEGWITDTEGLDWSADGITTTLKTTMQDAMADAAPDITRYTSQTVGGALGDAEVSGQGQGVGEQMDAGLAAGIRNGASGVVEAARGVAQSAVDTIRDTLQIHSPSRVMMGIGEFTGEGFSLGLRDSIDDAVKSAQNVVGLMNLRPSMDFSGLSGSFGTALSDYNASEGQQEIALYIGASKMASTMAGYNNRAINGYVERLSMGYGRG